MFNMNKYEKHISDIINNNLSNVCLLCDNRSDKPAVITSSGTHHDEERAKELGIWPISVGHAGGSIILFPKDMGFTWFSEKTLLQDILNDILKYLKKYNSKITLKGNDVMLGNNKLFGTMSNGVGPYYEGMFFSFDTDLEVIRQVCLKEMEKEPLGLSSIGVTPEEMTKLAGNLAKKYNLEMYGGDN